MNAIEMEDQNVSYKFSYPNRNKFSDDIRLICEFDEVACNIEISVTYEGCETADSIRIGETQLDDLIKYLQEIKDIMDEISTTS